jgi:hypothetical protein
MPQKLRPFLEAAVKARDTFENLVIKANVRTDEPALIGTSLCLTIQELFASVICLMDNGLGSHAPAHARTMLEALADLRNIANDPAYLEQMRFDDARENLKIFAGYEAIEGMPQNAIKTLKKWSAKAQPVFDAGKASGFKKQKIDEKLKKAGLEQEYVSYGFLCGFAHNQLTAIISRHGKHHLKYLHEPPYETMVGVLGLALSITGKAIQRLPAFSDLQEEEINRVVEEVDAAWETARA